MLNLNFWKGVNRSSLIRLNIFQNRNSSFTMTERT